MFFKLEMYLIWGAILLNLSEIMIKVYMLLYYLLWKHLRTFLIKIIVKILNICLYFNHRNINDIFEECCTLIEQRHICGVISTGCWNSLIHGALHEKYQHIKGASFESEFLAMHKLYFRQVIGEYWAIKNTIHRALHYLRGSLIRQLCVTI